MPESPELDIHAIVICAVKAADSLTAARLKSGGRLKWGEIKASAHVLRMCAEQLDLHAAQHPNAPKKKDDG